jgi:hypothetical protein
MNSARSGEETSRAADSADKRSHKAQQGRSPAATSAAQDEDDEAGSDRSPHAGEEDE